MVPLCSYEKSGTHQFEVPRMLLDDPLELENYVMKSKDRWAFFNLDSQLASPHLYEGRHSHPLQVYKHSKRPTPPNFNIPWGTWVG